VRRGSGGDVRESPRVRLSNSVGSPSSIPIVAGYEWVRDNVLKYKSSLTSASSVAALHYQVKLASPEDSCKLVVQACRSDDFPFMRATPSSLLFFYAENYV